MYIKIIYEFYKYFSCNFVAFKNTEVKLKEDRPYICNIRNIDSICYLFALIYRKLKKEKVCRCNWCQ